MKQNKTNLEILVLVGIPASGKSTFRRKFLAENPGFVAVSRDDFRQMTRNVTFEPSIESLITQMVNQTITTALQNGKSVLVDATHCKESTLNGYTFFKDMFPVKFSYEFFPIELEEAIKRDSTRGKQSVGEVVITKMYEDYQTLVKGARYKQIMEARNKEAATAPTFDAVTQNKKLPEAVIFDIDGTLAKMKDGGRGPFEWHRVGEDDLVPIVLEHAHFARTMGRRIIIMSGRDAVCRPHTEAWLKRHGVPYDDLFMRPEKDMRKDSLIKNELFRNHVLDNYHTKVVYDDREQVVTLWRALGLTCFQVAESPD